MVPEIPQVQNNGNLEVSSDLPSVNSGIYNYLEITIYNYLKINEKENECNLCLMQDLVTKIWKLNSAKEV